MHLFRRERVCATLWLCWKKVNPQLRYQRYCFFGSMQESVKTRVFLLEFTQVGWWASLATVSCAPALSAIFSSLLWYFSCPVWLRFLSASQSLKGLGSGACPVHKTAFPIPRACCRKGSKKSADPRVRAGISEHLPSNQSLRAASHRFCLNLPRTKNDPRGSRIGHHRLRSHLYSPSPRAANPSSKPQRPWVQKPAPIEHSCRFSCRAVFSTC